MEMESRRRREDQINIARVYTILKSKRPFTIWDERYTKALTNDDIGILLQQSAISCSAFPR